MKQTTISLFLIMMISLGSAAYPPLSTEISPDHPAFLFAAPPPGADTPAAYGRKLIDIWNGLPVHLQPFSLFLLADAPDTVEPDQFCNELLPLLREAGLPVVLRVADQGLLRRFAIDDIERYLKAHSNIRGIEVSDLQFDVYEPELLKREGVLPEVRWLMEAIDKAAQYGRFVYLPLGDLHWSRMMANPLHRPLYNKIRACAPYVIPAVLHRGRLAVVQNAALMGLWLEGAVRNWGIAADLEWYEAAAFTGPGLLEPAGAPYKAPSSLYRAMMLNGAMTGASVYSFAEAEHLWFGAGAPYWNEAILPTLTEFLEYGLVVRKDFVEKRAPLAYQLAPSDDPLAFHQNLRDLDPVLDEGLLIKAAYKVDRPGQVPELILNSGRCYWIPIISCHAPETIGSVFTQIVGPGHYQSVQEWEAVLRNHFPSTEENEAFVTQVGRGIYVMNTLENDLEEQRFYLRKVPAPVRQITARRQQAEILLNWPFREGDVSYTVYRRVLPSTRYEKIADGIEERQYVDTQVDSESTVAYSVTALTSEQEAYAGAVGYGEYKVFSIVRSRMAEEVVSAPLLLEAVSTPLAETGATENGDSSTSRLMADLKRVSDTHQSLATVILERVEDWEIALHEKDLNGILDVYSIDYTDPQGWQYQYAWRAYQWLFEQCNSVYMGMQVRRWDFSAYESTGEVRLLMYCKIHGNAISDPSGRYADLEVVIPGTPSAEVWITWRHQEGVWRITSTNPALPNFRELLSYVTGPYNRLEAGPDVHAAP